MSTHIRRLTSSELHSLNLTPKDLDLDRGQDGHVMSHQVICCSDGHFIPFISKWMIKWFAHDADLIATPGSGLELCLDHNLRDALLQRAELLRGLHETDDLWCIFHNGCGAYAHHRTRPDPKRERAEQLMDMEHIHNIYHDLGLLEDLRLHFGIALTSGPSWVPLSQLARQARGLRLDIPPLRRDLVRSGQRSAVSGRAPLPIG